MTDLSPGPRHAEVARRQHKTLAWTTAGRIRRMAGQVEDDYGHDRPVTVEAAQQIVTAALTLYREAVAIATRDEIAARTKAGVTAVPFIAAV